MEPSMLHLPAERLAALVDGDPTSEEADHLAVCAPCADEWRAYRTLGNLAAVFPERGIGELSAWVGGQFDPSITWRDVAWVRERWPGKLVLKGILDAGDAKQAAAEAKDTVLVP